jgi:hypothetical protein
VPAWTPHAEFALEVRIAALSGRTSKLIKRTGRIEHEYADDIEDMANRRHADPIAIAATLARYGRFASGFSGPSMVRPIDVQNLAKSALDSWRDLARDEAAKKDVADIRSINELP